MVTDEDDSKPLSTPSVLYLWYLGFAAQIPWTIILVYLPLIEPILGGVLFSFAVGIAMGLACNIVRFLVVVFGRKFTFKVRVIWGSLCSSFFTLGFFIIVLVGSNVDWENISGLKSMGFWLGLLVALLGGAGNAQLMSTGYGVSALISRDQPIANSLFFFGQATASASCWPLKLIIESIVPSWVAQAGIAMTSISVVSLSIIPMFLLRLSRSPAIAAKPPTETTLTFENAKRAFRKVWFPCTCLWLTYYCTNLVTPGQLMLWTLPETNSTSAFLTDHKLYRSLCSYTHLLADALGKSVLVIISLKPNWIKFVLNFRYASHIAFFLLIVRFSITVFFFIPPPLASWRFVFLAIFGFLNGLVASLCLSLSIHRADPIDTDLTGYISSFIIINGLFAGSVTGILVHAAGS